MRQTVASIKADLLRTPLTAYSRAKHAYDSLAKDLHADPEQIALYSAVVESLSADGYAPDLATGQPGPATTAHYASRVGAESRSTPPYASYTADTHSLAGVSAPGEGSTPDPDIND